MGEEIKDYKLYFKMAEDESDDWKQLSNSCHEVREELKDKETYLKTSEAFGKLEENPIISFKFIIDAIFNNFKNMKKILGLSPLSKKRTRKLLMSKGFDRNTAQMYADTMKPRNMTKIRELIEIAQNSKF